MKYYFSPTISYKAFKKVCDKFPTGGIILVRLDKILWKMLRARKINIGIENSDDPIFISTRSIPIKAKLICDKK